MNAWKSVEVALTAGARIAWPVFQAVNRRFDATSFQPKWAPAPLLKSTSAPRRVGLAANDRLALPHLRPGNPGAHSLRRPGPSIACQRARRRDQGAHLRARRQSHRRENLPDPRHVRRHARDQSGVSAAARIAVSGPRLSGGYRSLHNHGTSSIKYGRGAVLTIDLTNRCNMMCDPCFMDANQVGYVHELTLPKSKSCSTTRSASSPGGR